MKVFDLTCDDGHRFEGWFASADAFAAQQAASEVCCPVCDSSGVQRSPSAPRLNLGGDASPDTQIAVRSVLDRLRRVVAAAENVGDRFAEEARRIHYEETPARSIRGTATESERRQLDDEGIEIFAIPPVPALTETLQ